MRRNKGVAVETAIADRPPYRSRRANRPRPSDIAAPFASEHKAGPRPTSMVKKNQKRIPANLHPWIHARRRFHLSHEHVQMPRELGMNPKKLEKLDNHGHEQ